MTSDGRTPSDDGADLVLRGGAIHVMDRAARRAAAVAIEAGRIVEVGTDAAMDRWIGSRTRLVELAGRSVLPGINDSHVHACWLGARWPHTLFPSGSHADAAPTGRLAADRSSRRAAILRAGQLLSELGITSYTEPGIGPGEDEGDTGCFHSEVLDVYRELASAGELRQRVTLLSLYGVLDGPSDADTVLAGIAAQARTLPEADQRWLHVSGVKVFGDLIPLARGAWTTHAYDDGTHGDLLVTGSSLEARAAGLTRIVAAAHLAGLQVGIHATGDRTIGLALDAIEAAAATPGAPPARGPGHVVIHGDLATPAQIRRMGELGVWLNMQPGIATRTADWTAAVIGDAAAAAAWQFEAALDAGVLVLSSDAPVLDFDWRRSVADADARIVTAAGREGPSESAGERLHGLLRALTAVPARQDGAATWKGTVEIGKVADLIVLSGDPYEAGAAGLPGLDVDLTVLDGRIVFDRAATS